MYFDPHTFQYHTELDLIHKLNVCTEQHGPNDEKKWGDTNNQIIVFRFFFSHCVCVYGCYSAFTMRL